MAFLYDYGLFFAKAVTFLLASLIFIGMLISLKKKSKENKDGDISIEKLNDRLDELELSLRESMMSKSEYKKWKKQHNKDLKQQEKKHKDEEAIAPSRLFVLQFDGDIRASAVEFLREEITALLTIATPEDEVLVTIESSGGMVHQYGLAASQLQRIRDRQIPLTVAIDRVAASGGYMMACVANKIIAAPFAILGSIGVIAQIPNFNRVLKKYDIDYEQISAGEYKRTLTLFGPNTDKGREKFQQEIDETHQLFKQFVKTNREIVEIDKIATGEHWYGQQALDLKLCDAIQTSDDYLLDKYQEDNKDIFHINYVFNESLTDKIGAYLSTQLRRINSFFWV